VTTTADSPDTVDQAPTPAPPTTVQRISAWLPPHTHHLYQRVNLFGPTTDTWTWTTPDGTWEITYTTGSLLAGGALSLSGPGGGWDWANMASGMRQLRDVLVALQAIDDPQPVTPATEPTSLDDNRIRWDTYTTMAGWSIRATDIVTGLVVEVNSEEFGSQLRARDAARERLADLVTATQQPASAATTGTAAADG
jgi:hypothetical protein